MTKLTTDQTIEHFLTSTLPYLQRQTAAEAEKKRMEGDKNAWREWFYLYKRLMGFCDALPYDEGPDSYYKRASAAAFYALDRAMEKPVSKEDKEYREDETAYYSYDEQDKPVRHTCED